MEFRGCRGVWMVYSYNDELTAMFISDQVLNVVLYQKSVGYGTIGFWPTGMTLHEAIEWWKGVM